MRTALFSSIIVSTALLAACSPSAGQTAGGTGESSSSAMTTQPLAKEGELCGGIAALECETGLICVFEAAYPDAGGKCMKQE